MYPLVRQLQTLKPSLEREPQRIGEIQPAQALSATTGQPRPLPRARVAPPRHKLALLTWLAAYAVITLILALLGPAMAAWPLALRTLVLSALMVATLTWLIMPGLTRLLRAWLTQPA